MVYPEFQRMLQLLSADGGDDFAATVLQIKAAQRWQPTVRSNPDPQVTRMQACTD
jgi:hypothetical protein